MRAAALLRAVPWRAFLAGADLRRNLAAVLAPPGAWLHAGRSVLAALLALYLAYELELDNPASAAVTVLIVAHPVHGMLWSKSLYRAAGTLAGALMAILLAASCAQAPELFLLGFGLWMGLCTALSTLLRNFRSYGAILAGYTVALIVFPTLPEAPEHIFTLVVARLSAVLLGVACSALVGSLLTSRSGGQMLERRLRATLADLAEYLRRALAPEALPDLPRERHRLRGEIAAVDGLVEFAAAEATAPAGLLESQQVTVAAMFASLTAAAAAHDALAAAASRDAGGELALPVTELSEHLEALAGLLRTAPRDRLAAAAEAVRADLGALRARLGDGLAPGDFAALRVFDRLDDLLDDLAIILDGLTGLLRGQAGHGLGGGRGRLAFHREWRWAALNGLRAMLAVWLAAGLWIVTAWPAGGLMIGAVVPNVGLLSLRDRPDLDSLQFLKGISLAVLAGLLCLLVLLPRISGFPLLALVLGVFLFWGMLQSLRPARALMGLGFMVFFLTLLAPLNAMHYDIGAFLNGSLATLGGAALTAVVHRVVLPMHPRRHVRALLAAIRAEVQELAGRRRLPPPEVWETRMHDRLLRLSARLRATLPPGETGQPGAELLHGAHAALRIGREILRLRRLLAGLRDLPGVPVSAAAVALRGLGRMAADPRRAVRLCRLAAGRLRRAAAAVAQPEDVALALGQAATALVEIALLLGRHRRFFRPAAGSGEMP